MSTAMSMMARVIQRRGSFSSASIPAGVTATGSGISIDFFLAKRNGLPLLYGI